MVIIPKGVLKHFNLHYNILDISITLLDLELTRTIMVHGHETKLAKLPAWTCQSFIHPNHTIDFRPWRTHFLVCSTWFSQIKMGSKRSIHLACYWLDWWSLDRSSHRSAFLECVTPHTCLLHGMPSASALARLHLLTWQPKPVHTRFNTFPTVSEAAKPLVRRFFSPRDLRKKTVNRNISVLVCALAVKDTMYHTSRREGATN